MTDFFEALRQLEWNINFASDGLAIVVYVLKSLALYSIAKRRGIKKPGLAWVPLADMWILGSVSDQYQYVVKGQVKNKRKILLGLNIAMIAITFAFVVTLAILLIRVVLTAGGTIAGWIRLLEDGNVDAILKAMGNSVVQNLPILFLMLGMTVPMVAVSISFAVVFWMALHDVFKSCDRKNSTTYLVISIVGGMMVEGLYSVFLLLCREKDLGMPPRKQEPAPTVIDQPPVEPWDNAEA